MTPLCFANPSPPSGWTGDFHPQAIEHAGHTTTPLSRKLVATRGVAGSRRPVLRLRGLEPHPRQEPPNDRQGHQSVTPAQTPPAVSSPEAFRTPALGAR